ncbi:MAG TPA: hypothetical protein VIU37_12500, partial [Candidatus Limnocylindrales bacterium]
TAPLAFVAGLADWPGLFVGLGQWLVGSAAIAVLFVALGAIGVRIWDGWDGRERAIARREPLGRVDRRGIAIVFAVLVAVVVAVSAWLVARLAG